MHGRPFKWSQLQNERDDSIPIRTDHDIRGDCWQEDSIHKPCLHLQGSHSGRIFEPLLILKFT